MRNPLQSERNAFRFLMQVAAVFLVFILLVVVLRLIF